MEEIAIIPKKNWKKHTTLFLTSQTVSLFGSSLVQYAITWYITLQTKSGTMMMISILCGFLPTLLLSPFAGVWADRYDRKKLIILADGSIAFTTLVLAILYMKGHGAIWLLFLASAIRALGAAVQTPAVGAFLPEIVPENKLMRVNSINGSIQSATMLLSPILSGVLLTFTNLQNIFFIDVVTAIVGMSILGFSLKVPKRERILLDPNLPYFKDLNDGFHYIKSHHFLRTFFRYYALLLFLVAPGAFLTSLQVTRVFGSDVWRLTAVEVCFSIGMMGGGILLGIWGGFKNRANTMVLGTLIMGICTLSLGLVPWFWVYLSFMIVFGVALMLFSTPANVMIQEKVEDEFMGRVFGVMTMISSSMMPLGMLLFGPIADWISIEFILIVTGILIAFQSLSMYKSELGRGE